MYENETHRCGSTNKSLIGSSQTKPKTIKSKLTNKGTPGRTNQSLILLESSRLGSPPHLWFELLVQKYLSTSYSKVFVNFLFKSICQHLIQKYLSTSYSKVFVKLLFKSIFQLLIQKYLSTSYSKVFVNIVFKSICQLLIQKYLSTSGLPSSPPLHPPRCLVSV